MRNTIAALLLAMMMAAPSARAAANPNDYTSVLVPLTSGVISGVNGSRWTAELTTFNVSGFFPLRFPASEEIAVVPQQGEPVVIAPRTAERVFLTPRGPGFEGAFVYIPRTQSAVMTLRVRDLSVNASSLGTDIPLVTEMFSGATLADIPTDSHYRATLRIYCGSSSPLLVGVTVYPEDGDTPIEHYNVMLNGITPIVPDVFPTHPAYYALDPLTSTVRAADERVRIELTNYGENVSPPFPAIWAFVTLTHNETQQVTTVTPR